MRHYLLIVSALVFACATQPPATHKDAIEKYFAGFTSGDFSRVPLDPDVVLMATRPLRGSSQLRDALQQMAVGTRALTVRQLVISGDHGCAEVSLEATDGKRTAFVDCFDFTDGRIAAIRVYVAPAAR